LEEQVSKSGDAVREGIVEAWTENQGVEVRNGSKFVIVPRESLVVPARNVQTKALKIIIKLENRPSS